MTLKLNGSSSGSVSIDAPASTAGGADKTITLPDKTAAISPRMVLEEFGSPCDGSVIATLNGNITFPNVTGEQVNTSSYADVTGSVIAYNPPTGTTQVHYYFSYYQADVDDPQLGSWKLFLDSDEVTKARNTTRVGYYAGMNHFEWIFNIGGSADTSVGRVASWSSAKTMKLQWIEYGAAYNYQLHETVNWESSSAAHLCLPILKIKAIG